MNERLDSRPVYLFTDCFPWGPGEKPFVIPEITALLANYDVIVVSLASNQYLAMEDMVSAIPEGAGLLHWRMHSRARRLLWAIAMPFTSMGRLELKDLWRDGFTPGRLRDSLAAYARAKSLQSWCKRMGVFKRADEAIYYGFWFSTQCLALALEKAANPGLRIICRTHGYDLYNERQANGRQPWQRFMRDCCDRVLFLSEKARRYFEIEFGDECFSGQYIVNGLGVSSAKETPELSPGETPRIVSCSNVIPLKRVDLIAQALAKLPRDKFEWVHFGEGPERSRIENLAKELGLCARFMGRVDNAEIRSYYESNHVEVFVTTSSTEGVPVSIMEALASRIPIVGTDVGGISDQIDGNGILLSNNPSSDEVARAIANVCLADGKKRAYMRMRSYEIWAERYDVNRNKLELARVLNAL